MARSGSKARPQYRCSECQHVTAKWVGRCPECGTWGAVDEVAVLTSLGGRAQRPVAPSSAAVPISAVDADHTRHLATGVPELDRVLGGGIVSGSVTLLAGEPGVGKSTLLLEVVHRWAQAGRRALYISGEESAGQIRMRAERTGCTHDQVYLASESDVHTVLGHIEQVRPSLVVVDSVQTLSTTDTDGVTGGVTQVRAVTTALTGFAKSGPGVAMVIVGHVTKDGAIAGPRALEHLVDVVLHFEGDRNTTLRMVRGVKNRFGAADEVGCFVLHDNGIECVADPSGLFLDQRGEAVPGTAVTVTLDGKRPLIGEIQALIGRDEVPSPRRAVSGLDQARAAMTAAVLQARAGLKLGRNDIYLSTVGGMRLTDPSSDLAVALAMASAYADLCLPTSTVVIGEVGLAGDLRRVTGMDRRLAEAARLGFTSAIIPKGAGPAPRGIKALEAATIGEALRILLRIAAPPASTPPEVKAAPRPGLTLVDGRAGGGPAEENERL
ncbi:DNA repair protein RadA [Mycolicibacterium palauense]|uniref:DNA repair protein RadA n=1 Tax=Mycolicibacterium palauense TaxID=2034511 RepID=UPI000BFEEA3B|nr:DNA repair protein RadA [Mycolicibacterium palauense]